MEYTHVKSRTEFSDPVTQDHLADFLYNHLDEYGDRLEDINRCIDYAMSDAEGMGGSVFAAHENGKIAGVVVMNTTGMKGYIPENLLVYIAVHADFRGRGVGKNLMQMVIDKVPGDIALHVEPHNPAVKLYEKVGFENKYLEMRYIRK